MSEQFRQKFLGDLGEYLLAWCLRSKFGINVTLAKTEGIDLLCRDEKGDLFPKEKLVTISVKTRERRKEQIYENVKVNWDRVERVSKNWGAKPYFAYVRIVPEMGKITLFLLPVSKAKTYSSKNFNVRVAESKEKGNIILFEMKFKPYQKLKNWRPLAD